MGNNGIQIQLLLDHYDSLLTHTPQESPAYSTLKNGVIVDSDGSRVIVIVCDADQAELIRDSAKHFCPQAVPQIETWIRLARLDIP